LSFLIPLITFTTVKYIESATTNIVNSSAFIVKETGIVESPEFAFQWYHYLLGLYALGVLFFGLHFLFGYFRALSIVHKAENQIIFDTDICVTKEDVHPFSFFNKIVISKNTLTHPDLRMIVNHETIHVKEKHTVDILITELMFIAQWFNPFAWLIKDAVKNNLEYITDNRIVQNHNPQAYQLAMLTLADKDGIAPFLTALNGSQLKNRIIMMKKKSKNRYAFVKQLIVLPLLAILVMGLSNKEIKTEVKKSIPEAKASTSENIEVKAKMPEIVVGYPIEKKDTVNSNKEVVINSYGKQKSYHKDSLENLESGIIVLANNNNNKPPLYVVDGKITDNIKGIDPQQIDEISVLKGKAGVELYGDKGKNGVVLIKLKEQIDLKSTDNAVVVGYKKYNVNMEGASQQSNSNLAVIRLKGTKSLAGQPLYIVDGKEVDEINSINPNEIASISVLKNESATKKYGDKGKNGVIIVKLKEGIVFPPDNSSAKNEKMITTITELYRAFAMNIKYPLEAQEKSLEGVVTVYVKMEENGGISEIPTTKKPSNIDKLLDEMIVTAYAKEDAKKIKADNSKLFNNEVLSVVVKILPLIKITELKGKVVGIPVRFVLQQ
jgi:hypothetical protein